MKKLIALLLISALLVTPVYADIHDMLTSVIAAKKAGGGGGTETTVFTVTEITGRRGRCDANNECYGMSFQVSQTCDLTEVVFYSYVASSGNSSNSVRVGTSSDLSSSYLEESDSVNVSSTGEIAFTFDGTTSLSTGTTYYAVVDHQHAGAYGDRTEWSGTTNNNTSYGDGEGSSWNMGSPRTGEAYLIVKGNV